MLAAIAESSIVAWPLAITMATVVVADRARTRRRRERLNRAIHELRRPLQALTLSWPAQSANGARDHLGLALEALGELDRRINDPQAPVRRAVELVDARALADAAVQRWRAEAAGHDREIGLRWRANGSRLVCDPSAVARALDNLIANSLEHGSGPIRVEGSVRGGRLRMSVADGPQPGLAPGAAPARRRGIRRGHGLQIVAEIAADHGGRFAACAHRGGARAVIELPLAGDANSALR